jgi:hypothetical protein
MGDDMRMGGARIGEVARYRPATSPPRKRGSMATSVDSRLRGNDALVGGSVGQ